MRISMTTVSKMHDWLKQQMARWRQPTGECGGTQARVRVISGEARGAVGTLVPEAVGRGGIAGWAFPPWNGIH